MSRNSRGGDPFWYGTWHGDDDFPATRKKEMLFFLPFDKYIIDGTRRNSAARETAGIGTPQFRKMRAPGEKAGVIFSDALCGSLTEAV
jgi:hypothetical protein